jgi:tetratricopeptide (TPR) repeat protein
MSELGEGLSPLPGTKENAGDPRSVFNRDSTIPDGVSHELSGSVDENGRDPAAMSPPQLLEWLCSDQVKRWRSGQRIPAETYLIRHPTLEDGDGEAAVELIYGEFLLREELGESPALDEFIWRFPRFATRLQRQLDLHGVLQDVEPFPKDPEGPALTMNDPTAGITAEEVRWCPPGYKVLGVLGRGGMGAVYKAWQIGLKRVVALKVIRADAYADAHAARFQAEAEAAARFQHPNIVPVFEVGEHDGMGYLVLEFAAGGGLDRRLAAAPQDPHESARLIETLARAIHYAHQRGIVHRDLKPANVLLTEDGVPKITDFGLVKFLERDQGLTQAGVILGTPSYMAPEQTQTTSQQITPAVDVYALGAILYEMLTGRPPFKGTTPLSTLEQVRRQEPLPPTKLQRHTPRDLETICLKCLEKEPRRRYATALDLAEELLRFQHRQPIVARPTPAWERAWKWARRRPAAALLLLTLGVMLAVISAGGVYYNAQLRAAVRTAEAANRKSQASARAATEQQTLALKALNQLIYGVQEKLAQTPATRSIRQSLLDTALAGLDEIALFTAGSPPDVSQAVAHQKLGEIFRTIGRYGEAQPHYERARQIGQALLMSTHQPSAVQEVLYQTHMGLGLLDVSIEQLQAAKAEFERAVAISESIARARPGLAESRREVIEAYYQLGRAQSFAREYDRAEDRFRIMQDLAQRWVSQEPRNSEARDLLASSFRKLGDLRKFARDFAAARNDYRTAITIASELVSIEKGNLEFKSHLATALDDMAGVDQSEHRFEDAMRGFREAERLSLELVESDPQNLGWRIALLHTQLNIARLEADVGRFDSAANLMHRVYDAVLALEGAGQLDGRRTLFAPIRGLKGEIAFCEAAPRALEDFDFARSQPAPVAARLLLLRARMPAPQNDPSRVSSSGEAMSQLTANDPEDLYQIARELALLVTDLDSAQAANLPQHDRMALRRRCADRAVTLLGQALARGFADLPRLESYELESLRQHAGYQAVVTRLKQSRSSPSSAVKTSE